MKIKTVIQKSILFIWQLPQTFLAWILIYLFKRGRLKPDSTFYTSNIYKIGGKFIFAVSLGDYIFIHKAYYSAGVLKLQKTIQHEYGHSIQSKMLWPLYLLIVGLPSATFNVISRFNKDFARKYYTRWPENWADKLGKVDRK